MEHFTKAGIIFTLLGAAADEVKEEQKKQKKLGKYTLLSRYPCPLLII